MNTIGTQQPGCTAYRDSHPHTPRRRSSSSWDSTQATYAPTPRRRRIPLPSTLEFLAPPRHIAIGSALRLTSYTRCSIAADRPVRSERERKRQRLPWSKARGFSDLLHKSWECQVPLPAGHAAAVRASSCSSRRACFLAAFLCSFSAAAAARASSRAPWVFERASLSASSSRRFCSARCPSTDARNARRLTLRGS